MMGDKKALEGEEEVLEGNDKALKVYGEALKGDVDALRGDEYALKCDGKSLNGLLYMFQKKYIKLDRVVGGCGLANPSFSQIF